MIDTAEFAGILASTRTGARMTDGLTERKRAAIWGALVADAASLGLHWLYDQERIRRVAPEEPEFRTPTEADFDGVSGYFAHGKKMAGELSHYGEQARVLLGSLVASRGVFRQQNYQEAFRTAFGYGGDYVGYVDHAMRDTLNQMERAKDSLAADAAGVFLGAHDEQLSALSKLPALVVHYVGEASLESLVDAAVRVTNNHETAVAYGRVAARMIEGAILTADPGVAVERGRLAGDERVSAALENALDAADAEPLAWAAELGLSCDLQFGVPVVCQQLLRAESFQDAVRRNIWTGGDSCGRAILLGAVTGACFGVGGERGIPEVWLERLVCRDEVCSQIDQLLALH